METVLRLEGVSKQYRVYDRAADRLKEMATLGRWKTHREFWALRDVSFEVERGTSFGIVGPNGSGKSTLLQLVAGTLQPTHGSVWHTGRVAALLELGAGFNPEFTGIENVLMNASLMGFSNAEAAAKLPDIERFAEIGEFIRQPVKTYSTGMYVRLAFASAISVMPDILIVDEALAVGDAVFQHRCMRRIREMQESGLTILLVSHDPNAIRALCSKALLLQDGRMEALGKPGDVLNRYQKLIMARESAYEEPAASIEDAAYSAVPEESLPELSFTYRHGDGSAEITAVALLNTRNQRVQFVESGEEMRVRFRVYFHEPLEAPVCGFLIRNRHGIHIYGSNTQLQQLDLGPAQRGDKVEVSFVFNCWLAPDTYSLTLAVHSADGISHDWLDGVLFFSIVSSVAMEGVVNLNAGARFRRIADGLQEPLEAAVAAEASST